MPSLVTPLGERRWMVGMMIHSAFASQVLVLRSILTQFLLFEHGRCLRLAAC